MTGLNPGLGCSFVGQYSEMTRDDPGSRRDARPGRSERGAETMRRPRLVAFHVMMVVAYSVISGAYAVGWTRLGLAGWVAAFGTCLALLPGCAASGHAAR